MVTLIYTICYLFIHKIITTRIFICQIKILLIIIYLYYIILYNFSYSSKNVGIRLAVIHPGGFSLEQQNLLEVQNLSKSFPGVKALDSIDFQLKPGSVHAVCGENGAGKSTLMKILMGVYTPDSGNIRIKGKPVTFHMPKQALDAGIAMIEQELNPIHDMTVAENLFLGREETILSFWVDYSRLNKKAEEVLAQLDLSIDPAKKMKELSLAEVQLVEIAKAISYDSDVVIMDEPTSAIGEKDVKILFKIIKKLKKQGKGIIYVSHRMHEIFAISDTITILRDGRLIGTNLASKLDLSELIRMMIGRKLGDEYVKTTTPSKEVLLEVAGLSRAPKFVNIDLKLFKGEILGIFGLMGSGRSEFFESLFGVYPADSGTITIGGQKCKILNPRDAKRNGLAFVTEDRKESGLVLKSSVRDNVSLPNLKALSDGLFINGKRELEEVDEMTKRFSLKTPSLNQLVSRLSGGNQQKVVLSKWLLSNPRILLLDEPTRGIDVGAKWEIYAFMSEFAKQGNAVIMISSEIPEVLGMSDRIAVFCQGKKVADREKEDLSQDEMMHLASEGVQQEEENLV